MQFLKKLARRYVDDEVREQIHQYGMKSYDNGKADGRQAGVNYVMESPSARNTITETEVFNDPAKYMFHLLLGLVGTVNASAMVNAAVMALHTEKNPLKRKALIRAVLPSAEVVEDKDGAGTLRQPKYAKDRDLAVELALSIAPNRETV